MDLSPIGWIITGILTSFGVVKAFGKTYLEETIKGSFSKDLEKFKSDLTLEVSNQIEPFKASLSILVNRQGELFNLEKVSIVEFNETLNSWLYTDMGIRIDQQIHRDNLKLRDLVNVSNNSYHKVRVYFSKMNLIVENRELINEAQTAISACLKLKHFVDDLYLMIAVNIEQRKPTSDAFLSGMSKPGWITDPAMQEMAKIIGDYNKDINTIQSKYTSDYNLHFIPAINAVNVFVSLARQYLKNRSAKD